MSTAASMRAVVNSARRRAADGTRPAHAPTAQAASATAAPRVGRAARRLQTTKTKPSPIAAAHCVPAECVSARIASFLRALTSEWRASASNAAVAASASAPPAQGDARDDDGGRSASATTGAVTTRPSSAAPSRSTALARATSIDAAVAGSALEARGASAPSTQCAAQRSGSGPALSPSVSWKRSRYGARSASMPATASPCSRRAPAPSFASLLSARARSSAARSGRTNASVARAIACARSAGSALGSRVARRPAALPHSAVATCASANAPMLSHIAGSTGAGKPATAMPRSRKRWSRPQDRAARRARTAARARRSRRPPARIRPARAWRARRLRPRRLAAARRRWRACSRCSFPIRLQRARCCVRTAPRRAHAAPWCRRA